MGAGNSKANSQNQPSNSPQAGAYIHSDPSGKPYAATGSLRWNSNSVRGTYSGNGSSSMFAQHTRNFPSNQSVTFGAGYSTSGRANASVRYSKQW